MCVALLTPPSHPPPLGLAQIFRKDYLAPANFVTEVSMDFDIEEGKTIVKSDLVVRKNVDSNKHKKVRMEERIDRP